MPTPILPNIPPLNSAQKAQLIQMCNTYPNINRMLHYLQTGELKFSDMPMLSAERKSLLESQFNKWLSTPEPPAPPAPSDPEEIAMWEEISAYGTDFDGIDPNILDILENKVGEYLSRFSVSLPGGNHVAELQKISIQITKVKQRHIWEGVDILDYDAIVGFLDTYPNSPFFSEAEGYMWEIVNSDLCNIELVERYMIDINIKFKSLKEKLESEHKEIVEQHLAVAKQAKAEYLEWQEVKTSEDVIKVTDYLREHPSTPFKEDVKNTIVALKQKVLSDFKNNLFNKDYVEKYKLLTGLGIISKEEFIEAGIISETSMNKLEIKLPDIDQTKKIESCPENHTDVFMFGIPLTGKTCLIMGLLGAKNFIWNSQLYGGKYGSQLNLFLDNGLLPGSTNGNFVSLITGSIKDPDNEELSHPVSLIDMAGEDFAFKIADNPDGNVAFEDMGEGATELLKSPNDKVFFIIVDPTVELVPVKKKVMVKNEKGEDVKEEVVSKYVSQKNTIKGLVDLFALKENNEIMKRVKAIHFIVTKSDVLANDVDNVGEVASSRMKKLYYQSLDTLQKLCKDRNFAINARSKYLPKVYTFSLGKFYLGGVYDYDSSDAEKILNLIASVTKGIAEKTFIDKLRNVFNKPIL